MWQLKLSFSIIFVLQYFWKYTLVWNTWKYFSELNALKYLFFFFKDVLHQKMTETCATAHIGGVNIVLLEGITPNIQ